MFMLFGRDLDGYYIGQSRDLFAKICGMDETDFAQIEKAFGFSDETENALSVPTGLLTLPFNCEGLPEDIAPIADVFSWLLASKLAEETGLPLVDRTHLPEMLKEIGLGLSDVSSEWPNGHVFNAGRMLGAGYMISGSIHSTELGIQATVRVFDAATTRIAVSAAQAGNLESLEAIVESLGKELASQLNIEPSTEWKHPVDLHPMLNLHYMRGLIAYYNGLYPEAAAHFTRTLMDDPEFIDARFHMAKTYMKMSRHGEAYTQFHKLKSLDPQSKFAVAAEEKMTDCLSYMSADEIEFIKRILY